MAEQGNRYIIESTFTPETREELIHPTGRDEEEEGDGAELRTGGQVAFIRTRDDEVVAATQPATLGLPPEQHEVLSLPLMRFLTTMAGVAESSLARFMRRDAAATQPALNAVLALARVAKDAIVAANPRTAWDTYADPTNNPAGCDAERAATMVVVAKAMAHCVSPDELPLAMYEFAGGWSANPNGTDILDAYRSILEDVLQVGQFPTLALVHVGALLPSPAALRRVLPENAFTNAPWAGIMQNFASLVSHNRQIGQLTKSAVGEMERLSEGATAAIDQAYSILSDSPAAAEIGKEGLMRSDAAYVEFATLCAKVAKYNEVMNQTHYTNPKIGEMLQADIRKLHNKFKYRLKAGPPISWV